MYNRALKLIRQYHRLTQTELAKRLGISKSYVNDIERDRRGPSLDVLRRYASTFEMPLSSLQLFAERASDSHIEKVRTFAADKVLKMLEWVADEPDETADRRTSREAHSAR